MSQTEKLSFTASADALSKASQLRDLLRKVAAEVVNSVVEPVRPVLRRLIELGCRAELQMVPHYILRPSTEAAMRCITLGLLVELCKTYASGAMLGSAAIRLAAEKSALEAVDKHIVGLTLDLYVLARGEVVFYAYIDIDYFSGDALTIAMEGSEREDLVSARVCLTPVEGQPECTSWRGKWSELRDKSVSEVVELLARDYVRESRQRSSLLERYASGLESAGLKCPSCPS